MRLIDADALIKELEKVYEYYMAEIKDANEHPEKYTSKFIPAVAGRIDGIVDAEIVIADAPTIEPDTDLISRQDAIDAIRKSVSKSETEDSLCYNLGLGVAEKVVNSLPSAPDSRQRGEWVGNHNGTFVCDQCGCKHSKSNFCPNCGARMGGDET